MNAVITSLLLASFACLSSFALAKEERKMRALKGKEQYTRTEFEQIQKWCLDDLLEDRRDDLEDAKDQGFTVGEAIFLPIGFGSIADAPTLPPEDEAEDIDVDKLEFRRVLLMSVFLPLHKEGEEPSYIHSIASFDVNKAVFFDGEIVGVKSGETVDDVETSPSGANAVRAFEKSFTHDVLKTFVKSQKKKVDIKTAVFNISGDDNSKNFIVYQIGYDPTANRMPIFWHYSAVKMSEGKKPEVRPAMFRPVLTKDDDLNI